MRVPLSSKEIEELKLAHRLERERRGADRIKAILLLDKGMSYAEVSRILLLDDETIRRYEARYRWGGVRGLLEEDYKGSEGKLLYLQEEELKRHLSEKTYLTTEPIVEYVFERYGVRYSMSGMQALLHRLGFVYKKAKGVPGKANRFKQEVFLETYAELKAKKGLKDRIYFLDGVHPQHNTLLSYGWILKGTDCEVKTNTGRKRLNLSGALELESCEVVIRSEEALNGRATIELFKTLEAKHPEAETIYVISDNASYYQSQEVLVYLETSRVKRIPLPTYSPNLNPIERLWKFFKKKVLYNRYYEKFPEFKKACLDFFETLDQHKPELRSLLTENFQLVGN